MLLFYCFIMYIINKLNYITYYELACEHLYENLFEHLSEQHRFARRNTAPLCGAASVPPFRECVSLYK